MLVSHIFLISFEMRRMHSSSVLCLKSLMLLDKVGSELWEMPEWILA